jgi:hypothetical protein
MEKYANWIDVLICALYSVTTLWGTAWFFSGLSMA